jgi:ribosomal protein S27E
MNNENLLCDLESDIDKNWEEIHNSIQKKEIEEKVNKEIDDLKNNPLRMRFPNFAEFYETMFCIYQEYLHNDIDISYDMRKILDRMFYRNGIESKMSPAFDYIWGMFCDPSKYIFHTFICNHCNNKWDVVFNRMDERMYMPSYHLSETYAMDHKIPTQSFHRVLCPNCSNAIGNITSQPLGIFRHKELSKEDILDKERYKQFLKEGGYGIR